MALRPPFELIWEQLVHPPMGDERVSKQIEEFFHRERR